MHKHYEIHLDESGLYAHNVTSPGVFVEAKTEDELCKEIALAAADLIKIQSDRPALHSRFSDPTRQLLCGYGFVNRGLGDGNYEVWARGATFLTVPAPLRATKSAALIASYAFLAWRREVEFK